jgi:hypothetical protein
MAKKNVKRKSGADMLPTPPEPDVPPEPYDFGDFVRLVQKDFYYGRAIHRIVAYGMQGGAEELWAEGILKKHVTINVPTLKELGIDPVYFEDKCSANTKFIMLQFTRYS